MKKYSKELKDAPPVPFIGLTTDDPKDGGFTKAINVDFINGEAERRNPDKAVDAGTACMASRGYKSIYEFRKGDGSKYIYAELEYDDGGTPKLKVLAATNESADQDVSISAWSTPINDLTTGDDVIPRWATGKNMGVRVDGTNDNKVYRDLTAPENCGVAAPASKPTLTATAVGSLLPGYDYYFYYTYVKKVGTYEVESYPSPISDVLSLVTGEDSVSVFHNASSDADVTHIRIYRNLAGTQENYYKAVADVANASASTSVILSDDEIAAFSILDFEAGKPPTAIDVIYAADRMWYLTEDKLTYSKDSAPENVPSLNYSFFDQDDGNENIGLGALRDSIIVFKRRKMWNVSLYSPFASDVVSRNLGCVDKRSIVSTGKGSGVIWLSYEGVIFYDGGEMQNITQNRINSSFEDFFNKGNNFIGRYDNLKQQYHLIMFYRNDTDTEITNYSHFVYSMQEGGNTWSEYQYKNSDDELIYSTAIGGITNNRNNDLTIKGQVTATGTTAYLSQMYDLFNNPLTPDISMKTGTDTFTTTNIYNEIFTISDAENSEPFKITGADAGSTYATELEIQTAIYYLIGSPNPGHPEDITYIPRGITCDRSTGDIYLLVKATGQDTYSLGLVKMDGTTVSYSETQYCNGDYIDGDLHFFNGSPLVIWNYYNIADETVDSSTGSTNVAQLGGTSIDYDDDYYYVPVKTNETWDKTSTTHELYKYDTSFAFVSSLFDTETSQYFDLQTFSSTKYYFILDSTLKQADYSSGVWTITDVPIKDTGSIFDTIQKLDHDLENRMIVRSDSGFYRYWDSIKEVDYFEDYFESFNTSLTGFSYLTNDWVAGIDSSDDVYKILEPYYFDRYWSWLTDDIRENKDLDFSGVVVELISARTSFGIPQYQKTFHRLYLETISEKCSAGVMYLEGDTTRLQSLHSPGESTTPDMAISGGGFTSPGWETWKTEYKSGSGNMFDSQVDNLDTHRIDVKLKGSNYRWSLKMGDVPADITTGIKKWVLKPPRVVFILLNMEGGQSN